MTLPAGVIESDPSRPARGRKPMPPASRRHRRIGDLTAPAVHTGFGLVRFRLLRFKGRRLHGAGAERGGRPGGEVEITRESNRTSDVETGM